MNGNSPEERANEIAEEINRMRGKKNLTAEQRLRRRSLASDMAKAGWLRSEIAKVFGLSVSNVNDLLAR